MITLFCIRNSHPREFVKRFIKEFLDGVLKSKIGVSTVPENYLTIVLPYLGKLSIQILTRVNRVIKNKLS